MRELIEVTFPPLVPAPKSYNDVASKEGSSSPEGQRHHLWPAKAADKSFHFCGEA